MTTLGQRHLDAPALPRGRQRLEPSAARRLHRERLLSAALATVAQSGFAATTVSEIARRARCSPNVFYAHFTGKADCVLTAVAEAVARAGAAVGDAVAAAAPTATPEQRLGIAMRANLEFFAAEPELSRALHLELRAAGSDGRRLYLAVLHEFADYTRDWHRAANPAAAARTPRDAYLAAIGAVEQLVVEKVDAGETDRLGELAGLALEVTLAVLDRFGG